MKHAIILTVALQSYSGSFGGNEILRGL